MLALIAAIAFLFACFNKSFENVPLLPIGLFFLALHLAIGGMIPWPVRRVAG